MQIGIFTSDMEAQVKQSKHEKIICAYPVISQMVVSSASSNISDSFEQSFNWLLEWHGTFVDLIVVPMMLGVHPNVSSMNSTMQAVVFGYLNRQKLGLYPLKRIKTINCLLIISLNIYKMSMSCNSVIIKADNCSTLCDPLRLCVHPSILRSST